MNVWYNEYESISLHHENKAEHIIIKQNHNVELNNYAKKKCNFKATPINLPYHHSFYIYKVKVSADKQMDGP